MTKLNMLIQEVFDSNWNVKLCGRYKCKELINILYNLTPDIDFGDYATGMMNIENIKSFCKEHKLGYYKGE